ncbi:unnamed protein product [Polarella glacialis]|uniref:Uncharacterized protein n=1 Tax=Polarella glacialis TaxID=89957 RepID=A0A813LTN2_POLGL|nr:unnamed protein product [Polarella glacialis]
MVEQASPFWVSVARSSGFRRLHRTGCCPIRRENCWGSMSVYEIKPGIADAACKDCQRKGAMTAEPTEDSSSSSGSSSSDEDEQVGITDGQVSAPPPNAANVDADLQYLWEDSQVEEGLQYRLAQHYKSVRLFGTLGDDRSEVRIALKADYDMDPANGPAIRAQVGAAVCAWESAKDFTQQENKLRAESKILGTPRIVAHSDKLAMKRAVEGAHGKIPDAECPSTDYLSGKIEDIEDGEVMASPLDEVVSRKEAEHATLDLTSAFDGQGRLRLTTAKHKGKLPTTTEELRTKYRIEGNLWLMLAAKFRNKPWLVGTDANTFQTFASYILGEKVALIEIPKADGTGMQQLGPPWQLVLHYEYTLRREALKRVQEGDGSLTLDTALRQVTKDSELKELCFTGPLALSRMANNKRGHPGLPEPPKAAMALVEWFTLAVTPVARTLIRMPHQEIETPPTSFDTISSHVEIEPVAQPPANEPFSRPKPVKELRPILKAAQSGRQLRVLYLYAGLPRKCDVQTCLLELASTWSFTLTMKEVDLLRSADHDVTVDTFWKSLMDSVDNKDWDVVIATPPCHTHSRARHTWRTSPGPRPIRSFTYSWGFPWLDDDRWQQCKTANICVERTFDAVCHAHAAGAFHLVEHPEDLGITPSGEMPASLWQLQQMMEIQITTGACTWALYQCGVGAETPKPTRLLSDLPAARLEPFQGWPQFTSGRRYLGPLPSHCGHVRSKRLLGKTVDGNWRTSPASAYPEGMCKWLALLIVRSCFDDALKVGETLSNPPPPSKPGITVGSLVGASGVSEAGASKPGTTFGSLVGASGASEAGASDPGITFGSLVGASGASEAGASNPGITFGSLVGASGASEAGASDPGITFGSLVGASGASEAGASDPGITFGSLVGASGASEAGASDPGITVGSLAGAIGVSDAESEIAAETEAELEAGNEDRPLLTFWDGKKANFNDGFGLCSPGRWKPAKRGRSMLTQQSEFCEKLRDTIDQFVAEVFPDQQRMVIALALGKVTKQPFTDERLATLRKAWFELLTDPRQAAELPEFQPFYLYALSQSLRSMGDPDWEVVGDIPNGYASGVPVGLGYEMPRTPKVFRKKVRWRKYDDSDALFDMKNYVSAREAETDLEKQFRSEETLGMMFPVSLPVAKAMYPGDRLRIAAQGAIKKPDGSYRALHDGTHGVRVNNEIRTRDQLEYPGPAEEARAMEIAKEEMPGVHFTLAADIRKAHRRVLHRKQDWGLMACRSHRDSEVIWINRVGTFGIGSKAYWWGRLAAAAGRFVLRTCGTSFLWMSIFADDLKVVAGGADKWKVILRVHTAWIMIGAPFAWEKFRGGLELDWVGYWLDYTNFRLGLSERRTLWLCEWLRSATGNNTVLVRRFAEGLGRLGFAAQTLVWMKPFMAPLYSWAAAVPDGAALRPPLLVQLAVAFILDGLSDGQYKVSCSSPEVAKGEVFRTDSKGADDMVVLGGWETRGNLDTKTARWFSLKLTKEQVPFLFKEGKGSSWSSTSSELLASMIAVQLFTTVDDKAQRSSAEVVCAAGTDKRANEALSLKRSSTKLPLMLIMMQLAQMLARRRMRLQLCWRPRDENTEADDLTNDLFGAFDPNLRMEITWEIIEKELLEKLLAL